jgi:chromosome segregation ATPase
MAALICVSQVLCGCAARRGPKPEEVSLGVLALDAGRFQARAAELQGRAAALGSGANSATDEALVVRLELAYINLDYRNPARNYSVALRELEAVLAHVPQGSAVRYEIENLIAALGTIQTLKERLERERQEVQRLREGLERLQDIEMEIEKKRRQIK